MSVLWVRIKGCRQNNLKGFDLNIPKQKLIVLTGVSGSGKSSLAFDTIHAEGQRRYLECLSAKSRMMIRQLPKADVEVIEGLSPTLAIGQGQVSLSSRGTVATQTEIHDFLCVLFSKIGRPFSPATGKELLRQSRQQIVESILKDYKKGVRLQILASPSLLDGTLQEAVDRLRQQGFLRLRVDGKEMFAEEDFSQVSNEAKLEVVVDRLMLKDGVRSRLNESVAIALDLGQGILKLVEGHEEQSTRFFSEVYVCPESGLSFAPLSVSDFNYRSSHGACGNCKGRGGKEQVVEKKILFDQDRPLEEQVLEIIEKFPKKKNRLYEAVFRAFISEKRVSEDENYAEGEMSLTQELLFGSDKEFSLSLESEGMHSKVKSRWKGLVEMVQEELDEKPLKSRFAFFNWVEWIACEECFGTRIKKSSRLCKIQNVAIHELCAMTVQEAIDCIGSWKLQGDEKKVAEEILPDVLSRLELINQVGLGYLELNRQGATLSQGEAQRVQLASQIGAKLSGVFYILDEPSTGLHPSDTKLLGKVLSVLKELGNTVLLIEHKKELLFQADYVIEMGPGSGEHGGEVTFQGSYQEVLGSCSLTGKWLRGEFSFEKVKKRKPQGKMRVHSACLHNLKDVDVEVPLCALVGFCGVSGSGKSTFVLETIAHQMRLFFNQGVQPKNLQNFQGLKRLIVVEQKLAGISPRSNPATYVGIMTDLRSLFASTRLAKARGFSSSHFSLNKKGGRCDACEGMGRTRVTMPFMPDVFLPCEVCEGKRYNFETLQVLWKTYSIADVLDLSIEEACEEFKNIPEVFRKLQLMKDLGLDYLSLGQSFTSLSGGEVQRLKLVAELARKTQETTLYILDEPSKGLHEYDISKLVAILHKLVDQGHSVMFVEHHLEILKQADYLIELGPVGGPDGGHILFEGSPQQLRRRATPTGKELQLGSSH